MASLPLQPHTENDPLNFLSTDIIVSAITIAFAVCLDFGLIITTRRGVDVLTSDPIFSRVHIGDASTIASPQSVAFIAGLLFPLLFIFTDLCIRQSIMAKSVRRLTGYGLGVGITLLACGTLRAAAGGPSPDFLSVCAPIFANTTRITNALTQCSSATTALPLVTLASFPSTPAALSVYSTLLFAAYIRNHISMGSEAVATLLHAAPIMGGLAAAAAQAADARAHIGDVIVGILVGAACAAIIQVRFLGGMKRSYFGEDDEESEQHEFFSAALPVPAGPPVAASGKAGVTAARANAWANAWALAHAKATADAAAVRAASAIAATSPSLLRLALEPPAPQMILSTDMALETIPASTPHIPRSGFSLVNPAINPQTITERMAAVHARAMGLP